MLLPIVVPLLLMLVAAPVPTSIAAASRYRPLLVPLGGVIHFGAVVFIVTGTDNYALGQGAGAGGGNPGWSWRWG